MLCTYRNHQGCIMRMRDEKKNGENLKKEWKPRKMWRELNPIASATLVAFSNHIFHRKEASFLCSSKSCDWWAHVMKLPSLLKEQRGYRRARTNTDYTMTQHCVLHCSTANSLLVQSWKPCLKWHITLNWCNDFAILQCGIKCVLIL